MRPLHRNSRWNGVSQDAVKSGWQRTRLVSARGVRLRFEYEVVRDDDVLATGWTVLASTDRTGRPRRPPASLAERLGDVAENPPRGKSRGLPAVQDGHS